jgi:hypothetical protein
MKLFAIVFVIGKKIMRQIGLEGQTLQHQVITYWRLPIEVTSVYLEQYKDKSFAQIRIREILDYSIRHSSRTDTEKEADFKLFFKVRLMRSPE